MATDPLIPDYSPSIMAPPTIRRPKQSASALRGIWDLTGFAAHYGRGIGPGELVQYERVIVAAMIDRIEAAGEGFNWATYAAVLGAVRTNDSPEYWLCSAMVKTGTDNLADLAVEVMALNLLDPKPQGTKLPSQVGRFGGVGLPG